MSVTGIIQFVNILCIVVIRLSVAVCYDFWRNNLKIRWFSSSRSLSICVFIIDFSRIWPAPRGPDPRLHRATPTLCCLSRATHFSQLGAAKNTRFTHIHMAPVACRLPHVMTIVPSPLTVISPGLSRKPNRPSFFFACPDWRWGFWTLRTTPPTHCDFSGI